MQNAAKADGRGARARHGLARRQVRRDVRPGIDVGDPGPRSADARPAASRSGSTTRHRGVRERLSGLAARRVRSRVGPRAAGSRAGADRLRAGCQRGACGDGGGGNAADRRARPASLRRGGRALVRQEPRARPSRGCDPPRQRQRHRSARRRRGADRRRSGEQVVDAAELLRAALSQPGDAAARPGIRWGAARARTSRRRALPGLGAVDRGEGGRRHRRCFGDRLPRRALRADPRTAAA